MTTNNDWPEPNVPTAAVGTLQAGIEEQQNHRDQRGRFLTGNIGGGRPKGARNRLTESVLSALVDDFRQHGSEAIVRVRNEDPTSYLRILAALLPRECVLQSEQEPSIANMTLQDLQELIEYERGRRFAMAALASV